jgi:GT2 family glycosyltransferase
VSGRGRLFLSGATLLLLVVAALVVPGVDRGPLRSVVAFAALLVVPGGAVLSRLRVGGLVEWLGLAVAISLAVETASALAFLWTHFWHPAVIATALGLISAVVLVIDIRMKMGELRSAMTTVDRVYDGPVWCGELDRSDPATQLVTGRAADGRSYERARILVRDNAAPVAFVEVDVRDGVVDVGAARAATGPSTTTLAAMGQESVSVVVCTRDRPDMARQCIEHVLRLDPEPLELIIVDNAPSDGRTKELVDEYAAAGYPIRYVLEPRPGLSNARNAGVAAAQGDVVAFTDDDVRVDRHWIRGLRAGFARRSDVACVTGLVAADRLDYPAERYFESRVSWSASCVPRVYDLRVDSSPLHPYSAGVFGTGANVAFRTDVLRTFGGFDESLGAGSHTRGGEDLDAFVRVLRQGYAIAYEPFALAWHRHRHEPQALRRQIFGYGAGLTGYLTKYLVQPATVADIVGRVPRGMWRIGRAMHKTRAEVATNGSERWLVMIEVAGFLYGPFAYLRAKLAVHRRHRQRTEPRTVRA